jgi:CBS domain-containing protein
MERESIMRFDDLTTTDRDILQDALRIVRQFREMIRSRYNLEAF